MKWGGDANIEMQQLCVDVDASLLEAMTVLEHGAEAIAFVCAKDGRVIGSLTDGDIRRALLAGAGLQDRVLKSAMQPNFVSVSPNVGRAEVLDIMRARDIGQLPVIDASGKLRGLHTVGRLLSAVERSNWVVIMAGGRGSRLQPLTESIPKPMVKVAGRPILERLILHLMSCGLRRFMISVNYLADVIEGHFGDGARFGCHIEYLREPRPLGTGGSLAYLDPRPDEPFVVMNGDLVTQCDVGSMIAFHETNQFIATFGLRPYQVHLPFGVAVTEGDRMVDLREKPTEQYLINTGLYILSPQALDLVKQGEEFPITELFHRCRGRGLPVGAYLIDDDWIDVGQLNDLRRARGES